MSGLILKHEHYGTHLNNKVETVDEELGKLNFAFAAQTLCEVWEQVNIDNHLVEARYMEPQNSKILHELDIE